MLNLAESSAPAAQGYLLERISDMGISPAPIVVGGSGGSGTRLAVEMLEQCGLDFGGNQNESRDSLGFVSFLDSYIDRILGHEQLDLVRAARDLAEFIAQRNPIDPQQLWAWKNPRSIYVLPLLDSLLPEMRFVHVVRHGMDMATSSNVHQMSLHGEAVLGRKPALGDPHDSAELWSRVNLQGADYGTRMGDRYCLLRYEDLCTQPAAMLGTLQRRFRLPEAPNEPGSLIRETPRRWRTEACARLQREVQGFAPALDRFGYQC